MKKKLSLIWFIYKYGIEKYFSKNFKMYSPSVAGDSSLKGKRTVETINLIFPLISKLLLKLNIKSKIINSNRLNISLERSHSYPIWNPEIKNNISRDYKYIPIPINKGLNFNVQTKFDFFRYEMPNLNWKEITNVRSTSSVLSYEKENRVVTIQITNSYGKTLCAVNMSPKK